jgi:hypothetical protein
VKLSVDIGQHTGLAIFTDDGQYVESRTAGLGCGKGSQRTPCPWCGPPTSRLTFELKAVQFYESIITPDVTEVIFENVARHSSPIAAQLYGFGRGLILANCQKHGIPVQSMYQQTWKSRCGAKGTGKEAYVARAAELTGRPYSMADEDCCAATCLGYAAFVVKP